MLKIILLKTAILLFQNFFTQILSNPSFHSLSWVSVIPRVSSWTGTERVSAAMDTHYLSLNPYSWFEIASHSNLWFSVCQTGSFTTLPFPFHSHYCMLSDFTRRWKYNTCYKSLRILFRFLVKSNQKPPTGRASCASYLNTNYKMSGERGSDLANENIALGGQQSVFEIYELRACHTLMIRKWNPSHLWNSAFIFSRASPWNTSLLKLSCLFKILLRSACNSRSEN